MKSFIGAIAFLDSAERENRITVPMGFIQMADWLDYVIEFYKGEVMGRYYDGTEILISVYQHNPDNPVSGWAYDSDDLVDHVIIKNPYHV